MNSIFVFGSNLAGVHGAGSALEAKRKHGAESGVGVGRTGNAYAIPTKRAPTRRLSDLLPLETIALHVEDFKRYAFINADLTFNVVAIGCGLAGYLPEEIAPMFDDAPSNVNLPPEFTAILYTPTPSAP